MRLHFLEVRLQVLRVVCSFWQSRGLWRLGNVLRPKGSAVFESLSRRHGSLRTLGEKVSQQPVLPGQLTVSENHLTISTMPGVVDDVRGFNRFYTRVLGLL